MVGTVTSSRLFLFACLVGFAALALRGLHFSATDENIYFYLADAMASGALPYRDFFHAHPPLHLLPLALIYHLGNGFSLLPARILSALSTLVAGLLIARVARRPYTGSALVASAVFLFSFDVIHNAGRFTGTNLAAFWLALALERLCRGRDGQAAAAFCLGGATLLSVVPAAIGATLVLGFVDRRRGLRLALYGALGFAAQIAIALALFGRPYLDEVYFFHFAKSEAVRQSAGVFANAVRMNGWLVAGAAMGAVAWMFGVLPRDERGEPGHRQPKERRGTGLRAELGAGLPLALCLGASIGSLCFLASAHRIFGYYLQVLFVSLAPLSGAGYVALARTLVQSLRRRAPDAARGGETRLAACVLALLWVAGQIPGWKMDSAAAPDIVRESDAFTSARPLADEVHKRCAAGTTVFGDSTAAPLVALLADRGLALGEADTNHLRFRFGGTSAVAFIEALEAAPPCAVILRQRHGLLLLPSFVEWLSGHYVPAVEARDSESSRHYSLYVRVDHA